MGIPTIGKALISDRMLGITAMACADYLELGTGNTAFAITDTALGAAITGDGLARAQDATPTSATTTVTDDSGVLNYTWTATGAQTVKEAGSFNHVTSGSGSMLHREVLGTARALTTGSTYTYTVTFVVA